MFLIVRPATKSRTWISRHCRDASATRLPVNKFRLGRRGTYTSLCSSFSAGRDPVRMMSEQVPPIYFKTPENTKYHMQLRYAILRRRTLAYIYRYTPRGPDSSSDTNVEVGCERGNARMGTVWSARITVLAKKDVRPPYDGWTARYILSCEGHLSA